MTKDEPDNPSDPDKPRYYNVEKFLQEPKPLKTQARPVYSRVLGRINDLFDPMQGYWIFVLAAPLILLGPFGLLFLGLRYGPVAFYSATAGALGLATLIIERKFGRHIIVEEYSWKRILLVAPVGLIVLAAFLLVFYLAGRI